LRRGGLDNQVGDGTEQPVEHERDEKNSQKVQCVGYRQIQPAVERTRHDFHERGSITLVEA